MGVRGLGPQRGGPSQSAGGRGGNESRAVKQGEAGVRALSRHPGSCHQILRVGSRW